MLPLRRFNEQGLDSFRELLEKIRTQGDADIDTILWDENLTDQLSEDPILEIRPFANRREAGEYLYQVLSSVPHELDDVERDAGLWAWLAAAWLDLLAPLNKNGKRKPGETARWIPAVGNYRKYYRHLLAGPYQIYKAHRENPDRAMVILATDVGSPGDVAEQLSGRQEILSNGRFLEAATKLYYDQERGELKRGSASQGPGGARRLADIFEQFALTWDFYGMPPEEILEMFPAEFDRFRA